MNRHPPPRCTRRAIVIASARALFICLSVLWVCITYAMPAHGASAPTGSALAEDNTAVAAPAVNAPIYCGDGSTQQAVSLASPPRFTPVAELPGDAYPFQGTADFKPPKTATDLIMLRAWYRTYAWQAFVALNWPLNSNATPRSSLASPGPPQWTSWRVNYELYTDNSAYVPRWSNPRQLHQRARLPPVARIPAADMRDRSIRLLFDTSQAADGTDTGPAHRTIWDQNGQKVFYEVVLNKDIFKLTAQHKLYTVAGQIEYFKKTHYGVFFSYGSCTEARQVGSIALKFAWKVLRDNDHPERYLTMSAWIPAADNVNWLRVRVGLVGMHISQKTLTSDSRWLWSTFEHIDNLRVDDAEVVNYAKAGKALKPSFTDPNCVTCAVNSASPRGADGRRRTQIHRTLAIPASVQRLNKHVRQALRNAAPDSPLQYYELIGIQFATNPQSQPTPASSGPPQSITNKAGGNPDPTYLTNATLETFLQQGNQRLENLRPDSPATRKDLLVFGTQSCMGCHVDAALAVENKQGEPQWVRGLGDFHFQFANALNKP